MTPPSRLALALLLSLCAACRGTAPSDGPDAGPDAGPERLSLVPAADATLFAESGAKGDGAGPGLFAGSNGRGEARRALVRFDLAGVPRGARIASARLTLTLDHTSSGPVEVALRRVLEGWSEGSADSGGVGSGTRAEPDDATWSRRELAGPAWSTPGGTLAPDASANALVGGPGPYAWSSAGLARDVQAWLDDPSSNHGWAVVGDEARGGTAKRFCSREQADPALRPRLELTLARR